LEEEEGNIFLMEEQSNNDADLKLIVGCDYLTLTIENSMCITNDA